MRHCAANQPSPYVVDLKAWLLELKSWIYLWSGELHTDANFETQRAGVRDTESMQATTSLYLPDEG